jgi:hypothetical protein
MSFSISAFFRKKLGIQKRLDKLEKQIGELDDLCFILSYKVANPESVGKPKMIVPFLSGGLGNQLFQISCAYALSRKLNYLLRLNYDLHASYGQGFHPTKYQDTFYQKLKTTEFIPEKKYSYLHHQYKEITRVPPTDIVLEGYYQSSKYFREFREEIRHLFTFPKEDIKVALDFINKDSRPVVGVHIRLGDYLNHPELQAYTKDYFNRAGAKFPDNSRFVICSDQPDLACKLFKENQDPSRKPIEPELFRGTSELADLAFLSQCTNLIMSNSTFSYWAYFLGVNKTTVIAPKRWFNSEIHKGNHNDIYEKEWILV